MAKNDTPEAPVQQMSPQAEIRQLFADRDALTQSWPVDAKALKDLDDKIKGSILAYSHDEQFDADSEPVMAKLAEKVKSKEVMATRLMLGDRRRISLYQAPSAEKQLQAEDVCVNGVVLSCPRGKRYSVPAVVAEILEQAELLN
jgi:hypothetical protein